MTTTTQLAAALASQGIGVWGPHARHVLQLSHRELGLLASLLNGVPVVALLFIGPLLDRCGERLPVFIGMAIMSAGLLLMGSAGHYGILAVAMLLIGLGYSPIQPAGGKAIYQWFPPRQRGLAMGLRQAALPMGGACAAAFFPFMIGHAGWPATMMAASAILAAVGLCHLALFRNARRTPPAARQSRLALADLFRQVPFRRVAIVGMAMVGVQTAIAVFWAVLVHQRFGLSVQSAAWHLFAVQAGGALGRIAMSTLSDHVPDGKRRMVLLCALLTFCALLATLALPRQGHGSAVLACSLVAGVFGFGWYGPWVVWLSDCAAPDQIGRVLAIALAANQAAIAAVPLAFGTLLDVLPSATGWLALGGLLVLALHVGRTPKAIATPPAPSRLR
ncbi:MFS transporter [Bordetella genomosp. 13]|uniref:MFS transporter n=1 Tax=Bordetella genomosp. 13 TaxID=463040 RepID=UPI001642AAEC|nr:MFS transporter [Bordetella genomosp. 13]